MESIKKAVELKNELDELRPINSDDEQRIMQKFRLDWNYHSNNLEGNSLTYGETKALILFGTTAQGKPLKDHFEMTGHNEAVNWVMDIVKGEETLTENFIRQLHVLLLKEPREVKAITPDGEETTRTIQIGKYKTAPNHVKTVTGEIFRFATPEETPVLMFELIKWYREEIEKEVNPISLAINFHYKFIRIHPFDDGNGRVARILMNFILMKFGYPPVIVKTDDKENYFAALRQADAGDIDAFIDYIGDNLNHSLEIMIKGAKGESVEEPEDVEKRLAILDNKLKGLDSELNDGSFGFEFNTWVNQVLNEFYDDLVQKIQKYFTKVEYRLIHGDAFATTTETITIDSFDILEEAEKLLIQGKNDFSYSIRFLGFKSRSVIPFDVDVSIWFHLVDNDPSIRYDNGKKVIKITKDTKSYKVIDEMVNYELNKVLRLIENKVK